MRVPRWLAVALGALFTGAPLVLPAQTIVLSPDPACRTFAGTNLDSLSKLLPTTPSTVLTQYQIRSRTRLDSLLLLKCVTYSIGSTPTPTARTLSLSPTSLAFGTTTGGTAAPANVSITNSASSAAINALAASVSYTSGSGYLAVSLSGTATPATLTVTPATSALSAGTYTATITISGDSATDATIPVTVVVSTGPIIAATATSVPFAVDSGASSPAASTVTVSNAGGGTLTSLAANITYGAGQTTGWLAANLSGVTGSGGTLTLTPTTPSLAVGIYTATVALTATGAASLNIGVTLTVNTVIVPPTPPPSGTIAALPRVTPRERSPLAGTACTSTISSGLQAAITAATPGSVICLTAATAFSGNLTLPARGDTGWVEIRGAPTGAAYAQGTRILPTNSALLPKIRGTSTSPTITLAAGARGWALTLLEIASDTSLATGPGSIILAADVSVAADTISRVILDRVYVHGGPNSDVSACATLSVRSLTIIDSFLTDCHRRTADSYGIAITGSAGPVLIRNTFVAGAGTNLLVGGVKPLIPSAGPRDITVDRSHFYTPTFWRSVWQKRNIVDLRHAERLLLQNSVLEGSWTDLGTGRGLVIATTNAAQTSYTWASVNDITVRFNLIVCTGGALTVAGSIPTAVPLDSLTRRVYVLENYADSTNVGSCVGDGAAAAIQGNAFDTHIVRSTFVQTTAAPSSSTVSGIALTPSTAISATRLVWDRTIAPFGSAGISGCTGATGPRGLSCLPSSVIQQSVLVGVGSLTNYPAGFTASTSLSQALTLTAGVSRAGADVNTANVRSSLTPPVSANTTAQTIALWIGPTPDCGRIATSGDSRLVQWKSRWEQYEPIRWAADSSRWSAANYYDRGAIYYAMHNCYLAAGDTTRATLYLTRGNMVVADYLTKYLYPNSGGIPHHQSQMEGVAVYAELNNDQRARDIIGSVADRLMGAYYRDFRYGDTTHQSMENRIQVRALTAAVLAHRLGSKDRNGAVRNWARSIDSLAPMERRAERPGGSGDFCWRCTSDPTNALAFPYMDHLYEEGLIRYITEYNPADTAAENLIERIQTFNNTRAFRADSTYNYNRVTSSVGSPTATVDLNGLAMYPNVWLYQQTGDTSYRDIFWKLLVKMNRNAFLGGEKQFNQAYKSFRAIAVMTP